MAAFSELLGDKPTMDLLLKVLSYTAFYGGLVYLPLRLLAVVVGRVHEHAAERKAEQRAEQIRKATAVPSSWVIR